MDDEQLIRLVEVIECDVKLYGMVDVDLAEKMSRDMFDAIKVRVQSSHSL